MSSTSRYSIAYEAISEYLQRYTGANGNNDCRIAGLPHANSTDDFHNLVSRIKQSLIDNPANTNLDSVIQAILTRDSEIQTLREVNGEASHSAAAMINRTSRNQRRNPVSNSYRNQRVPPRSEVFLDTIEQQLGIDEPAFTAVLNTMTKEEDHRNQGW